MEAADLGRARSGLEALAAPEEISYAKAVPVMVYFPLPSKVAVPVRDCPESRSPSCR